MSYPYFFIKNENLTDEKEVVIKGRDFSHLAYVLRAKKGDLVEMSDNCSNRYKTELLEIRNSEAILKIKEKRKIYRQRPEIILLQCVLKKEAMELVIQKTTEIGITGIVPVFSSRVIVEANMDKIKNKLVRWQTIAEQASKQSKRDFICNIMPAVNLKDIELSKYGLFFVPSEVKNDTPGGDISVLDRYGNDFNEVGKIAYLIGPEGGFEEYEINFLADKGANLINFGRNILRSETASIYFLSVLDYLIKKGSKD
jgi:16S rRNA (uracil1498-N3)-methyltransferase